ncbi:HPr family phosphocarrier protein [Isoptericola jiangsuensis]|uniref:HPr family phosphocarrier protein n=1 Tax=Isoptericola jiangsuensis TaxID=548579 RepID=UPI003AB01AAA
MERHTVVGIPEGLHARTAARFARLAADQPVPVRISRSSGPGGSGGPGDEPGEPVDAASILAVMMLGADAGTPVTLHVPDDAADAQDASAALDVLEEFLAAGPVLTDPGR